MTNGTWLISWQRQCNWWPRGAEKGVPINLAFRDFVVDTLPPCRLICMRQGNRFGTACVTRAAPPLRKWRCMCRMHFYGGSDLFYCPQRRGRERESRDHTLAHRYQLEEICSWWGDWALFCLDNRLTTLIDCLLIYRYVFALYVSNKVIKCSLRSPVPKAMKRRGERRLTIKWPCGFGNCLARRGSGRGHERVQYLSEFQTFLRKHWSNSKEQYHILCTLMIKI